MCVNDTKWNAGKDQQLRGGEGRGGGPAPSPQKGQSVAFTFEGFCDSMSASSVS